MKLFSCLKIIVSSLIVLIVFTTCANAQNIRVFFHIPKKEVLNFDHSLNGNNFICAKEVNINVDDNSLRNIHSLSKAVRSAINKNFPHAPHIIDHLYRRTGDNFQKIASEPFIHTYEISTNFQINLYAALPLEQAIQAFVITESEQVSLGLKTVSITLGKTTFQYASNERLEIFMKNVKNVLSKEDGQEFESGLKILHLVDENDAACPSIELYYDEELFLKKLNDILGIHENLKATLLPTPPESLITFTLDGRAIKVHKKAVISSRFLKKNCNIDLKAMSDNLEMVQFTNDKGKVLLLIDYYDGCNRSFNEIEGMQGTIQARFVPIPADKLFTFNLNGITIRVHKKMRMAAFRERLAKEGYVDGKTMKISLNHASKLCQLNELDAATPLERLKFSSMPCSLIIEKISDKDIKARIREAAKDIVEKLKDYTPHEYNNAEKDRINKAFDDFNKEEEYIKACSDEVKNYFSSQQKNLKTRVQHALEGKSEQEESEEEQEESNKNPKEKQREEEKKNKPETQPENHNNTKTLAPPSTSKKATYSPEVLAAGVGLTLVGAGYFIYKKYLSWKFRTRINQAVQKLTTLAQIYSKNFEKFNEKKESTLRNYSPKERSAIEKTLKSWQW